jgi:glucan phosphoethanolaminetransferase (alkaline phosphatase superfamily)
MFSCCKIKRFNLSQIQASLIIAATLLLFHNFHFLISRLVAVKQNGFLLMDCSRFIFEFALQFFLLTLFLFCCSFHKKIFKIAVFILLILATVFAFFYNRFSTIIDQRIIANALDNLHDTSNVIDIYGLILYLFFYLLLPFFFICKFEITPKKDKKTISILAIIFIIFAITLSRFNHEVRKAALTSHPPISLIDSIAQYFDDFHPLIHNKQKLKPITEIIHDAKINSHKIADLKVVLIIGESARAKNFAIDGYKRNTTPHLIQQNNLLSFNDVKPCSNLTRLSVTCMLSFNGSKKMQYEIEQESIIKLFAHLGFTTAWLSSQKAFGDDNSLMILGMQSQRYLFGNSISKKIGGKQIYDEYLLDFLSEEIAGKKDNFVVLHTQGSHFIFNDRYPEEFKKFTPTCDNINPRRCKREALVNSYDNTVLYTDFFIAKAIEQLKDKNAILFYVSDHGQFLGENGIYYHGNSGDIAHPEHIVPMFLWMSDSLIKNKFYRQKFKNAQQKINQKLSHDNLFDSLLNCSGIDSKAFNRRLSLCK